MPQTYESGTNGAALAGSTELPTISWNFLPVAGSVEFVNSLTGGFALTASTIKRGSGTIVFDNDFTNPVYKAPISLFPGITLTNVKLYTDKTNLNGWLCPSIVITSTPQSCVIDGKTGQSFTFRTNGAYSIGS